MARYAESMGRRRARRGTVRESITKFRPSLTRSPRWVFVLVAVLVVSGVAIVARMTTDDQRESPTRSEVPQRTYRAFSPGSWWNTPLPDQTMTHPHAREILEFLRTAPESGPGCLTLAGTGKSPWGTPLYWASRSDEEYDVTMSSGFTQPPELESLRIPTSAEPADNSDGSMSVYDLDKGYVVALTRAEYDEDSDSWTAAGATVTYLDSNGLHVDTGRSDDPRNVGSHRGNNGATMAVPWDQVQNGEIRHVLKVAAGPEISERYIFPMVGSDGDYTGDDPAVPPQGLRMRIKASIELETLGLSQEALVIARALQQYGFYLGDSGGTTALKLENTRAEGRGQLWDLKADDLCGLPFHPDYWDVIDESYDQRR